MIKGLCHAEISGDAALLLFFFDTEVYLYHAASCHQSAVECAGLLQSKQTQDDFIAKKRGRHQENYKFSIVQNADFICAK